MNTDYIKQATDFLEKTGTEFKAEFLKNDKHFVNDTDERDIYKITLKRGNRSYSFNFGQSISNSGFYYTKGKQIIKIDRKHLNMKNIPAYIKSIDRNFLNNGKSDVIHKPIIPNSYDVFSCLQKYDVGSFDDFCSEFGYDTDSKKAEKIYIAVCDEYSNICRLFTDEEIEELRNIN